MAAATTFSALYDDVVKELKNTSPANKTIEFLYNSFNNMDSQLKTEFRENYNGLANKVRGTYMEDPQGLLDRHKCSACFVISFMEFMDKNIKTLPKDSQKLTREGLSLMVGLTVLRTFIEKSGKIQDESLKSFLNQNGGFLLPHSVCDEYEYNRNWKSELHWACKEKKMFPLSLANELFLIETYNRQQAIIEQLQEEIDAQRK
jgi:hypothetical protein